MSLLKGVGGPELEAVVVNDKDRCVYDTTII